MGIALGLASALPAAAAEKAAVVSLVSGEAMRLGEVAKFQDGAAVRAEAPWKPLKERAVVRPGDAVRTGPKGRLELTLPDASRVRLGPDSMVVLDAGHFGEGEERRVGLTVWAGRLWANVAKRLGGESSFEVKTQNAVAGVRGTSFTVIAQSDLSAVVKVYAGTVGVKKNEGGSRVRKQVDGPRRIDQKQWEEIIATAMKQVQISALGELAPAEDFEDSGAEREWAAWNQARDAAR